MRKLAVSISFLFSLQVFAYPIFFTCGPDKSLSTVLTPKELSERLNQLASAVKGKTPAQINTAVKEACQNVEQCIRDFSRLVDLAKLSAGAGRNEIVARIAAHAEKDLNAMKHQGFASVSMQDMSTLAQLTKLQTMTYECTASRMDMDPASMKDGEACTVGNFHSTPYMYVTGARESGEKNGESTGTGTVECDSIDQIITGAVAMGQDPLAALAIAFMEQGTDIEGLYLDPIGIVGALGCSATPVPASVANQWNKAHPVDSIFSQGPLAKCTTACLEEVSQLACLKDPAHPCSNDDKTKAWSDEQSCVKNCESLKAKEENPAGKPYNLNSYKTYYNVNFRAVRNPALAAKLKDYLLLNNKKVEPGSSYFCYGGRSSTFGSGASASVVDEPADGKCCLDLGFKARPSEIQAGLRFTALKGYVSNPLPAEHQNRGTGESAARRMQRFNGWSKLMGGAEEVPAWRSGVNYNNTPAYGYQAMDFMLNSLMGNPYIMNKIKEAQAKLGKKTPSVLCADLPPGSYSVPHDLYLKKHASAPRMGTIQAAWDSGKRSLSDLSNSQQNVLKNEINALCLPRAREQLKTALVSASDRSTFEGHCADRRKIDDEMFKVYMTSILPLRKTVAQASRMDMGYTWGEMSDAQFDKVVARVKQQRGYTKRFEKQGSGNWPKGTGGIGGWAGGPPPSDKEFSGNHHHDEDDDVSEDADQ